MKRQGGGWQELLGRVTGDVQRAVARVATESERSKTIGRGAAGDQTLVADKVAEDVISTAVLGVKGTRVLSEEGGEMGDRSCRVVAVVDPLDGSSNFSRGIPFYCTSVAIADGDRLRDVRVAMVRDLVGGDVYFAERGHGATKNGEPIRTSRSRKLQDAVLGADVGSTPPAAAPAIARLTAGSKRVVHFGANALELCFLAEGRIDAFVDVRGRMRVTDLAGACLIAEEAGAEVYVGSSPSGAPDFSLHSRFNVAAAANPRLMAEVERTLGRSRETLARPGEATRNRRKAASRD